MKMVSALTTLTTCRSTSWLAAASLSLGLLASGSAAAEDSGFLCQATQNTPNELPLLEPTCPIGDGVWGKKRPDGNYYWIQCGILNKPMSLNKAKTIYKQITTDIWMKPESRGYRCLIGPYSEFNQASSDLKRLKRVPAYKDVFIRAVGASTTTGRPTTKSDSMPAKTMEKAPAKVMSPKPLAPKPMASMEPKVMTPKPMPKSKIRKGDESDVEIRMKAELKGRLYVVPYLLDNEHQFYMEHNRAWNRLDSKGAAMVCDQIDMQLATASQWRTLLNSNIMQRNNWPMHLPYWGKNNQGFFSDGKITKVQENSLLNVLCVK